VRGGFAEDGGVSLIGKAASADLGGSSNLFK